MLVTRNSERWDPVCPAAEAKYMLTQSHGNQSAVFTATMVEAVRATRRCIVIFSRLGPDLPG